MPAQLLTEPLSPALLSDELLLHRLRNGEAEAGDTLVKRYYQPLARYLQRLAGDQMAEELLQQTWLSVIDHLDRFDAAAAGGFKAWLFRIATNKANDHWRSRGREKTAREGLRLAPAKKARPPRPGLRPVNRKRSCAGDGAVARESASGRLAKVLQRPEVCRDCRHSGLPAEHRLGAGSQGADQVEATDGRINLNRACGLLRATC